MRKWTRRKFLGTSLAGSMAAGAIGIGTLPGTLEAGPAARRASKPAFDSQQRELLRAAADEIIPSSDGMPAASEAGVVDYLSQLAIKNPEIGQELARSLAGLEEASQERFAKSFVSLPKAGRVQALEAFEKGLDPKPFAALRDFVYEAYYTQPRVWKLIGYEFFPTNGAGPRMKPFDEAVLSQVRGKPRFYREVS